MINLVWFIGGILAILTGIACAVGALLPRNHTASGSIVVPASPIEIWNKVRSPATLASWRPEVTKVESIAGPPDAPAAWVEHHGRKAMRLEVVSAAPPRTLEVRIDDTGQPFGGTWTFELSPEEPGTRVRITENGFVKLPPFRFVAKVILGHRASLNAYLRDLSIAARGNGALDD